MKNVYTLEKAILSKLEPMLALVIISKHESWVSYFVNS